ncbi:MAG TPA: HlyD family type I secretion periplasmic adaptor subunit [Dongiaceae bacterium]|nr:HlyD family type I secretion periplasmic adaptor subunit [Dongiaceae bacterium]
MRSTSSPAGWLSHDAVPRQPPYLASAVAGLALLVTFFIGFGSWAARAPLASAALASGQVRVESHRKTVQHLEAGIIREILVREGDKVRVGQPLLRLDDTQTVAALKILQDQHDELKALEARLLAERRGDSVLVFPADLEAQRVDPSRADMLEGQQRIFTERRQSLANQIDIIKQQIAQLEAERRGDQAQIAALDRQLALARSETDLVNDLVKKGLASRPNLLALQGQVASLEGARGEQLGRISQAEQAIGEARLRAAALQSQNNNEIETELRDTQAKLAEVEGKLQSARDQNNRMLITAPVSGQVVNLRVFTAHGVINPGEPLLDIVPDDGTLVIDARVQPTDIDTVHAGLDAQVALTAYKRRIVPLLDGKVLRVSADTLQTEDHRTSYYEATISIDESQLARLDNVKLYPGMPVEVMIMTGNRTVLDYAIGPVIDSFHRAFRED